MRHQNLNYPTWEPMLIIECNLTPKSFVQCYDKENNGKNQRLLNQKNCWFLLKWLLKQVMQQMHIS